MRRVLSAAAAALVLAAPASQLAAQSTLSVQGFGYPAGQFSTRALGTGGALGEFDPVSVVNPTSLLDFGRTFVSIQYDPEFRQLRVNGARQNNTIARFPVIAVGGPVRRRVMLGLSASTLLDRSFNAEYRSGEGAPDSATNRVESNGSIADIRLAAAYQPLRWLRLGVSGHALSGENRLVASRRFGDTLTFRRIDDTTSLDYAGTAATVGAELVPIRGVRIAGSYRVGGTLETSRNDSTLGRAHAPDRAGIALRVDRVTGAAFAVGYSRTSWSRMRGLGTAGLDVRDADELNAGVEAAGPRLGDFPVLLRLGGRRRTLPFGVGGAQIRETSYGGGFGLPLGGGRAVADVALQRAVRTPEGGASALSDARERAFQLSVGFTLRP